MWADHYILKKKVRPDLKVSPPPSPESLFFFITDFTHVCKSVYSKKKKGGGKIWD